MKETEKNIENVMNITLDGLSKKEILEVQQIFSRFMKKYEENPEKETVEWLSEQFQEEFPEKKTEEIQKTAEEIVAVLKEYDQDLEDLNKSVKKGISKDVWFADKIQDRKKGMTVNQCGDYLKKIDQNFMHANNQMQRIILRADEGVSQKINFNDFIVEQYHVNSFNTKAVLENSPYRARICVSENDKYGKNSVDVIIDDIQSGEKGIERYQFKYRRDYETFVSLLKNGDYSDQRIVVAEGQAEKIGKVFLEKFVTDHIGGTDRVKVKSDPITNEQIKKLQSDANQKESVFQMDWNRYQIRELAVNLGKRAGQEGIQSAFLGTGTYLAKKAFDGEKIEADDVVKNAIMNGSDTCVKVAIGGALKVASEKNIVSILPPRISASTIERIACVAVENVKILWKIANGELTLSEGLEYMGRTSLVMFAGLSIRSIGIGVGAVAFSFIPVVGPIIGGVIGGIIGYTAGNKMGETIFNMSKKVSQAGVRIVKKINETLKNIENMVFDTLIRWT